jgi:cell division septation protein DedD
MNHSMTNPQLTDCLALAVDSRFGSGVFAAICRESVKPFDDIMALLAGQPLKVTKHKSAEDLIAAGVAVDATASKPASSTPATPATPAPVPPTPKPMPAPVKSETKAPKSKGEQYAALVADHKTEEATRFLAEHRDELRAEMATPCPERNPSMTAREQFAFITCPVQRSAFYAKYQNEILGQV